MNEITKIKTNFEDLNNLNLTKKIPANTSKVPVSNNVDELNFNNITNINIQNTNNFSNHTIDNDIITSVNAPSIGAAKAISSYHFNKNKELINDMCDTNKDDLLYRTTIGADGNTINFTKKVIDSNGNIIYYCNDEIIKTIYEDGSVSFTNNKILNSLYENDSFVKEFNYYIGENGDLYYRYLYENGVSKLVHRNEFAIIDTKLGTMQGYETLEDGTNIHLL